MAKRYKKDPLEALSDPILLCNRSELDLFTPPKEQDSILSSRPVSYTPISSLDNEGPIVFSIPPVDEFTDLSRTILAIVLKVEKSDGGDIQPLEAIQGRTETKQDGTKRRIDPVQPDVTIPNDFFDCLIRKAGLEINSVRIGSDHFHHPQVSVLKNLLSYPEKVAEANLKHSILWGTDGGSHMRDVQNFSRYSHIAGSAEVTLISRLSHDGFNCRRLLPPGNALKIRIDRSLPEFALIRKENVTRRYKIRWEDACLSVHRVRVTERVALETERRISQGTPIYLPFTRTDARSFEIPSGSRHYKAHAMFSGILPDRALLVLLYPDSVGSGEYFNNPVIFPAQEFGVSQVQFFVDEHQVLPRPYQPNWEEKDYKHEYHGLLEVMNLDQNLAGSSLDYSKFGNDYGIFAANLRGTHGKDQGIVSVELRFKNATTKPIAGLLIPEFRSCIAIDSDKNVCQTDY